MSLSKQTFDNEAKWARQDIDKALSDYFNKVEDSVDDLVSTHTNELDALQLKFDEQHETLKHVDEVLGLMIKKDPETSVLTERIALTTILAMIKGIKKRTEKELKETV